MSIQAYKHDLLTSLLPIFQLDFVPSTKERMFRIQDIILLQKHPHFFPGLIINVVYMSS